MFKKLVMIPGRQTNVKSKKEQLKDVMNMVILFFFLSRTAIFRQTVLRGEEALWG